MISGALCFTAENSEDKLSRDFQVVFVYVFFILPTRGLAGNDT